jgi:GDP-4-dehydro-6-deoxy-D-mannose reductase
MAVWLVTGATGFVGRHVVQALGAGSEARARFGAELLVLGRRRPSHIPEHRFVGADLNDASGLHEAIRQVAPDYVIHTAGRTPPAESEELFRANFWATTHLLGALRRLGKPVRVVLSGSAAELGPVPAAHLPVAEDYDGFATDAYGRSKRLATLSGLSEGPPLEVMVARVFNAIGPGLPATQALGQFAARLSEPGADPMSLTVGDLDTRRDFIDVRDVAEAMITLALDGRPGRVYHVGTGSSRRVGDGLDGLVRLSGRSVQLRVDPVLLGRRGPADSRAAIDRIVAETGWEPRRSWEQSLRDLWDEVRDRRASQPWGGALAGTGRPAARGLPLTA